MSSQPQLLPSLYALLPPSSRALLVARLSLQSLHIEPYHIIESTYIAESTVIPNQPRSLRLQALRRGKRSSTGVEGWDNGKGSGQGKGKGRAESESVAQGEADRWEYKLSYLSSPLSGREYAEMNVRACIALDIVGMSSREDIEDFIETLGFRHSHTYTRTGYLFHLPLPTQSTLQLTITRLHGSDKPDKPDQPDGSVKLDHAETETDASEPYLVQLSPARPVHAVTTRNEAGLGDVMRMMRDVADRIDGLDWGTGR